MATLWKANAKLQLEAMQLRIKDYLEELEQTEDGTSAGIDGFADDNLQDDVNNFYEYLNTASDALEKEEEEEFEETDEEDDDLEEEDTLP